jgi:hypothetical protein
MFHMSQVSVFRNVDPIRIAELKLVSPWSIMEDVIGSINDDRAVRWTGLTLWLGFVRPRWGRVHWARYFYKRLTPSGSGTIGCVQKVDRMGCDLSAFFRDMLSRWRRMDSKFVFRPRWIDCHALFGTVAFKLLVAMTLLKGTSASVLPTPKGSNVYSR